MKVSSESHTHQCLRVIEFYAGIGGYHCALLAASNTHAQIVASIDINTNANEVYAHNFPHTLHLNRNICGITSEELDALHPDIFFLSPPCQPFTRQGHRRDNLDRRTDSFFHLMHVLSEMKQPPRYILVENVQGFETSQTREHFVTILRSLDYNIQEFLLSPAQFGIPNSRLRFYLLAKRKPLQFGIKLEELMSTANIQVHEPCRDAQLLIEFLSPDSVVMKQPHSKDNELENDCMDLTHQDHTGECTTLVPILSQTVIDTVTPSSSPDDSIPIPESPVPIPGQPAATLESSNSFPAANAGNSIPKPHTSSTHSAKPTNNILLADFLEPLSEHQLAQFLVPDKILEKYAAALDIVHSSFNHSCCFTKAYGNYAVGTGSVLQHSLKPIDLSKAFEEYIRHKQNGNLSAAVRSIRGLNLRYFTPREVANLMCFPETFRFPETLTRKQYYKVLGNSLNVYVVTVLMRYLFCD